MAKKAIAIGIGLILIFGVTGCINFYKLKDLRQEDSSQLSNVDKAKQLLDEMGEAHGIKYWDDIQTYNVKFGDDFYGLVGKFGHPFKENEILLSLNFIPKLATGQMEIISGKQKGLVHGIQDWETYYKTDDGEMLAKENDDTKFWIPTYQYFIELPNRIREATAIDYVGEQLIDGRKTEGFIASWNTLEPQKDIDQYIIWVDAETKRIAKVEYTIRDFFRFISGAAYYTEYKDYNGLLLPSVMPVESNLVKNGLLHTMKINSFTPNLVSVDSLNPLK